MEFRFEVNGRFSIWIGRREGLDHNQKLANHFLFTLKIMPLFLNLYLFLFFLLFYPFPLFFPLFLLFLSPFFYFLPTFLPMAVA